MGCPDGRCDGSGFLFDEERRQARDCSCRPRRIARRKARRLASVIPRRYQGVSFDRPPVLGMNPDVVRAVRRYVQDIDEHVAEGRGIWFHGDVGTGKTTLAMLISGEALHRGHSVAIYSLPRLLGMLRETFAEGADASLGELLDRLAAVDLLHVDDLGAEQSTPWVLEQLYTIVNTRYEDRKAIVLTTNLEQLDQLRAQIGERTVSRLVEMCGDPLPLKGEDHRMEADFRLPEPPGQGAPPWGDPAAGWSASPEGAAAEGWADDGEDPPYGSPRLRALRRPG